MPDLWFFPLGIKEPNGVSSTGGGTLVSLTCGCAMLYIGPIGKQTKRGLVTICWKHDGYFPMVDVARQHMFRIKAHLN